MGSTASLTPGGGGIINKSEYKLLKQTIMKFNFKLAVSLIHISPELRKKFLSLLKAILALIVNFTIEELEALRNQIEENKNNKK